MTCTRVKLVEVVEIVRFWRYFWTTSWYIRCRLYEKKKKSKERFSKYNVVDGKFSVSTELNLTSNTVWLQPILPVSIHIIILF